MSQDEFDAQAEGILPCHCGAIDGREPAYHMIDCPADYRSAVAATLREAWQAAHSWKVNASGYEKEIADLHIICSNYEKTIGRQQSQLAAMRAERDELAVALKECEFLMRQVNADWKAVGIGGSMVDDFKSATITARTALAKLEAPK